MKHRYFLLSLLCLVAVGCGEDGLNRVALEGTVSVGGVPVEDGYIILNPEPETVSPDIAGVIRDGKFSIPKKEGPVVGDYTVCIRANVVTGEKIQAIPGSSEVSDEVKSLVPARYTGVMGKSELTAKIVPGKNVLNLDIPAE